MALCFPALRLDVGPCCSRRSTPSGSTPIRTELTSSPCCWPAARDEEGRPLSDQELHDELIPLLVAGHETTAHALSCALYWIHRHPEVRQQLW